MGAVVQDAWVRWALNNWQLVWNHCNHPLLATSSHFCEEQNSLSLSLYWSGVVSASSGYFFRVRVYIILHMSQTFSSSMSGLQWSPVAFRLQREHQDLRLNFLEGAEELQCRKSERIYRFFFVCLNKGDEEIYEILVGALLPFFIFPYIGNFIIPIDFHIFQRGGLTTNQNTTCWAIVQKKWIDEKQQGR